MPTFTNPLQYGSQEFTWDPSQRIFSSGIQENAPGYLPELLAYRDRLRQGQTQPWEAEQFQRWEEQARAIPTRDIGSLTAGWQGESQGQWTDEGWREGSQDWWTRLDPGSPDAGGVMLSIRDKIDAGTASKQERELYGKTLAMAQDWNYRASVPQASDAFNPLGDQFFGALGTLALGATGGLAAAPLAAGGAGLSTTLGSLGTLAGIGGTAAGALGQEMDEGWLKRLGMGLGAAGGIAGGIGGLANLANRGVSSLGDAARLASSAGRVVGGVGAIADNDVLKQAGGWLGTAGQLGGGVENLMNLVNGTGGSLQGVAGLVNPLRKIAGQFMQPGGSNAAPQQRPTAMARPVTAQPQQPLYGAPAVQGGAPAPAQGSGGIQALLQAARQAQQQGLSRQVQPTMSNQDWLRWNWQAPQAAPQSTLWNL